MKNPLLTSRLTKLLFLGIALTSCNERTQFRDLGSSEKTFTVVPTPEPFPTPVPTPVPAPAPAPTPTPSPVPTPQPPITVVPKPVQNSGLCNSDSSTQLLSCMKCIVPANPPVAPQLSEKGRSLLDIVTAGCTVASNGAPKNYVPPTHEELLARMNRLSPNLYPDTVMTAEQKKIVSDLKTDAKIQRKLFSGLWYHPPYTDGFETYFGVTIGDVITNICYNGKGITPTHLQPVQSAQYINCLYSGDPFRCQEKPEYVKANTYRDQLHEAMIESINNPYVSPTPIAAKKCTWESFAGDYENGGEEVLARWLVSNFKVGIEIGNLGGKCEAVTSLPNGSNKPRGLVKMSGYICK